MADLRCRNSVRGVLASIIIAATLSPAALGETIYVDAGATGANTGTSWQHALDSLQDALLLAYFSSEPVEIRVARGTYRPDRGLGIVPGDREASFELTNGVTIKGGYAGTRGRDREVRNLRFWATILSGNIGDPERSDDNSFHVVTGSGTDATAVLDGCTITAGSGDNGGGMFNDEGSPTVIDCTFRANHTTNGAGLYNVNGSRPVLNNCTFSDNVADANGGAIYNSASSPALTNCTVADNVAGQGGALYNDAQSYPALTSCMLSSNTSLGAGGAVYSSDGSPTLADCTFRSNAAQGNGGAVFSTRGKPILLKCTFGANSAAGTGGAIHNGQDSQLTVANGLFTSNSALDGGAVANVSGNALLGNCTLVGNTATSGAVISGPATLLNCIVWDNTPESLTGPGINIRFSNVQGDGLGEGMISADPLFADPNSDYHLKSRAGRWDPAAARWVLDTVSSPCIDAGDPETAIRFRNPSLIIGGSILDPTLSNVADTRFEPFPNGGRINLGCYGGTFEASLSPSQVVLVTAKASNPFPPNGALGVSPDVVLTWNAGVDAVGHDVYLGTDFRQVTESTRDSPVGALVSQNQSATSYDPSALSGSRYYWWRVDEIDSEGQITKGDVWNFLTGFGPTKGRGCFTPDTPVWADGVLVPIAQVRPAQGVDAARSGAVGRAAPHDGRAGTLAPLCRDGHTTSMNVVQQLQEHEGVYTCYDVVLETGRCITVASCHYFARADAPGGWIALQDLRSGTRLQTAAGPITVAAVYRHLRPYTGKVYNLKIENADHYLVGPDALIARDY